MTARYSLRLTFPGTYLMAAIALVLVMTILPEGATARDDEKKGDEKADEEGDEEGGEEAVILSNAKSPTELFDTAKGYTKKENWGGMLLLRPPAHRRALAYKILLNARMAAELAAHHAHAERHRRAVPGRAQPAQEQGPGDEPSAQQALRPRPRRARPQARHAP